MRFLIIQTAFIGDVILATPLIEKLKRFYKDSEIDFLLRKGNENILENNPHLHRVITWDKTRNKFSNLFKIIRQIRKNKYDAVINLQRFASTGIITVLSGAPLKAGFDKNPFSFLFTEKIKHVLKDGLHEVNRNLELIRKLTDDSFEMPKIYPSVNDFKTVEEFSHSKYICIAPTSVWFTKQLSQAKWVELIDEINTGIHVFLLGGKEDVSACGEIIALSKNKKVMNLAGKLTLLQTAALMKNAAMNYVNDSAPMHLASAMKAPATAFFCSTIPGFGFGPLSPGSKIVETTLNLECRPCGLHGYKACPRGHFRCAESILMTDEIISLQ